MPPTANDFCRTFPWRMPWKWNGHKAWFTLSNGNIAHLALSIGHGASAPCGLPTHGHFIGFEIRIISPTVGEIESEMFNFDDHLKLKRATNESVKGFKVIQNCGWDWYCNYPISCHPFVDALEAYVQQFG